MEKTGKVIEIISAVLDIRFDPEALPEIYEEVIIDAENGPLTAEVAQDLGDGIVR
ncbi:MAG: F0F1 ATP synthase subunit beta, partial [Lachnospiraceae bacterium]|nr:F0F1 ATP synthase subunit beta [Lachnospiraceae bacterium]